MILISEGSPTARGGGGGLVREWVGSENLNAWSLRTPASPLSISSAWESTLSSDPCGRPFIYSTAKEKLRDGWAKMASRVTSSCRHLGLEQKEKRTPDICLGAQGRASWPLEVLGSNIIWGEIDQEGDVSEYLCSARVCIHCCYTGFE